MLELDVPGLSRRIALPLMKHTVHGPDPDLGTVSIEMIFSVPEEEAVLLYEGSCLVQTDENPLVILTLECNPALSEGGALTPEGLTDALLWMPGYARPSTLESVEISLEDGAAVSLNVTGHAVDVAGTLGFRIQAQFGEL